MPQTTRRAGRTIASALALALATGTVLLFAGSGSAAAAGRPHAQAVGRFLDGQLGPQSLEDVVDVKDARATNPGSVSDQNPLDVTLDKQQTLPLSHKLQLPGSGDTIHFGAANQVAKALSNGYAYGASGAVANSGGASIGGDDHAYPADATFNLSQASLPGSLSLPGAGSLPALGGITLELGAVSALAQTPVGIGRAARTDYAIGKLRLTIGSPALGGVLAKLSDALKAPSLPKSQLPGLPASCSFHDQVLSRISLDHGAVTINPGSGALTVDVAALLHELGLNLNDLPANTDLLKSVLNYLSSTNGLAKGLQNALNDVFGPLKSNFETCVADFASKFPPPLNALPKSVMTAINDGQTQVEAAISDTIDKLAGTTGSTDALAPLTDGLKKAIDIGANVQPHEPSGSFHSALRATPDQATPVVPGQTVVRALEINLLPAAGSSPAATIALANAAAGPSSAVDAGHAVAPTRPAPNVVSNSVIPTAVPAGQGTRGGSSTLPLTLLSLGVVMAGAGAVAWRLRLGRRGL